MALLIQGCISYEGSKVYQGDFQSPYTNEDYPAGTVINGYVLPPEPDHTENDRTLLGIDVNHNGMRDDIERYIIIKESENPHLPRTWTSVQLQDEKAAQYFWRTGDVKLRKKALECDYWVYYHSRPAGSNSLSNTGYSYLLFNTPIRSEVKYNNAMDPGVDANASSCDDNLTAFGELP
jgi:hypothetical protein